MTSSQSYKVINFARSQFIFVYIPMYSPELSLVEKIFASLKIRCISVQTRKSINWEKPENIDIISTELIVIKN